MILVCKLAEKRKQNLPIKAKVRQGMKFPMENITLMPPQTSNCKLSENLAEIFFSRTYYIFGLPGLPL